MGFYLCQGSYTGASAKAMIARPTDRSEQARALVESLSGTLHHFFFALGEADFVFLCELPDDIAAASVSLTLAASAGVTSYRTTKLLTAAEAHAAMIRAQDAKYAPPGLTLSA